MKEIIVDTEITLRIRSETDAERTFNIIDANRAYLKEWLPWVDGVTTIESCTEFIQVNIKDFEANNSATYGIFYNNQLVGMVGYHSFDTNNKVTSIGYWLAHEYTGKGITTKCVQKLVEHAFNNLKMHRVEIECATGNNASRAIPKKLGFTEEGVLRDREWLYDHYVDLVMYSKLSTDI